MTFFRHRHHAHDHDGMMTPITIFLSMPIAGTVRVENAAFGGAGFCADREDENDENADKKILPAMFLAGHRDSVLCLPFSGLCRYEEGR